MFPNRLNETEKQLWSIGAEWQDKMRLEQRYTIDHSGKAKKRRTDERSKGEYEKYTVVRRFHGRIKRLNVTCLMSKFV